MSDREFLARQLVRAFNPNGPDFDHVSEAHRCAAYRMADAAEGFYSERLGLATGALRRIAYMRPPGLTPSGPKARDLIECLEKVALEALDHLTPAELGAGVCQGSEADTAQGNRTTDEPPTSTAGSEGGETEWLRDHNLLYTLTETGEYRRGLPIRCNRLEVNVRWDPRYATDAEGEALIARLHAALANPTNPEGGA